VQSYANYGIMDYLRGLAHNFEMNGVDLITIHSILDIYSSKYIVSVIFQYYGTEFAHNNEQNSPTIMNRIDYIRILSILD